MDIARSPYDAAKDAHAICLLTEWDEFKGLDYQVGGAWDRLPRLLALSEQLRPHLASH